MSRIISLTEELLREHGYVVAVPDGELQHLLFESEQCIGIVIAYPNAETLLKRWFGESEHVLGSQKLALRRSLEKAWNSYLVLLADQGADRLEQALLDAVEENLVGTRKIARAGVNSKEEIARAILPLLPIQSPPNLQPVDMPAEIRIRTSQLAPAVMDAFFAGRDASTVMQLLEEI